MKKTTLIGAVLIGLLLIAGCGATTNDASPSSEQATIADTFTAQNVGQLSEYAKAWKSECYTDLCFSQNSTTAHRIWADLVNLNGDTSNPLVNPVGYYNQTYDDLSAKGCLFLRDDPANPADAPCLVKRQQLRTYADQVSAALTSSPSA